MIFGWLIAASMAWAQVPARTIEVQLQDPRGQVKSGLQASVRGSSGTQLQVRFRNDGQPPDLEALDTIHTTAFPLSDPSMALTLTSGGESWEVETTVDQASANPIVTLHLGPNGGLVVVQEEGAKPKDSPTASSGGGSTSGGAWVWAGLFLGVGLGLGVGMRFIGRRTVYAAPFVGLPDRKPLAPKRVPRGEVDSLLGGALSGHRVFVVGAHGACPEAYAVCAEPNILPAELVAAVEQAAVAPGAAVALLVLDKERLIQDGRSDPLQDLDARVAGRFPLYVVDGPDSWSG